jgi:hypothetical protein
VNGAFDFTSEYSLGGRDVFDAVAAHLVSGGAGLGVCTVELSG